MTPQPGIFAVGTPEHCYLELDLAPGAGPRDLARVLAGLPGTLTTAGGVNVVVGLRPELWESVVPGGFTMPATQPLSGAYYTVPSTQALRALAPDGD